MDLPRLWSVASVVRKTERATNMPQSASTLNQGHHHEGEVTMHPDYINPPKQLLSYTDEDYALVLNVWRTELGLQPLI